jgi:hypothetical protein
MSINPLNDITRVYLEQVAIDEAKVDEKLPEYKRASARDKRSGINLPGSGTRRTRRAEHEARRGKPKRWWDDDGDGIGWEKGEVKEVKKWFDNDGDGIGYEPGEVSGRFRRKKKKSVKEGYSDWRSDLIEVMDVIDKKEKSDDKIVEKKVKNKIKINPTLGEAIENLGGVLLEMEELDEKAYRGLGVGRVEKVSSGSYQAPETTGTAAKRKKAEEPKPVVAVKRKKAEQPKPAVAEKPAPKEAGRPARKRRSNSPSYAEVKAEIEAREQAKKTKGKKKKKKSPLDALLTSIRNEEVQIDEIAPLAAGALAAGAMAAPYLMKKFVKPKVDKVLDGETQRIQKNRGLNQMNSYQPEGELIDEKTLSKDEMKKREEIVKSMKDKESDFEKRYPGRGKEVMYATATKMAKKIAK